jgi:hypothetical protein
MGTNCAPLLADLFLYSYEVDFIQGFLKKKEKKLARSFNFMFHYIDDVLSLNNSRSGDFVDRIYPIELEKKDTTDTDRSCMSVRYSTPHVHYLQLMTVVNSSVIFTNGEDAWGLNVTSRENPVVK